MLSVPNNPNSKGVAFAKPVAVVDLTLKNFNSLSNLEQRT
jgi:hypothetical protein